jgi:hypothetical protein
MASDEQFVGNEKSTKDKEHIDAQKSRSAELVEPCLLIKPCDGDR